MNRAEEKKLKKAAVALVVLIVVMAISISIAFNAKTVQAADAGNADYTLEHLDHTIVVLYSGYFIINDTIRINVTGQAPNGFLIGFPYVYGSDILRCTAYNESYAFPVNLNVSLEDHVGFYGVKVNFPNGTPDIFTVLFVLSNDLIAHAATDQYILNFPAFPSLTQAVATCNASIILPEGAIYYGGTINGFKYSSENLPAFTYNASQVTFSLSDDKMPVVDFEKLVSEIRLNEFGELQGSDTYRITNKAQLNLDSIEVMLPPNGSNPTAMDQLGRKMADPVLTDNETNRYKITFGLSLTPNNSTGFTVQYILPDVFIAHEQANRFAFNISLFQNVNYYVQQASVSFILPEGARILTSQNSLSNLDYSISRNVFQELVTINRQGIISLDTFNVGILYEYNPLWSSFRPTLWIWALSILGCAAAFVWKRPKVPVGVSVPTVSVSLHSEDIKSFTDAYEEKRKIVLEIESLETRVQKGRIPRRRYKVQRKTLETRLNTLSRNSVEIKERMRAAGGKYADLMRQLEIAETEINEVEANIKSIEARHSRGELSLEAYRKLLADYQRRKDRVQTAIDGILLRLREEIR